MNNFSLFNGTSGTLALAGEIARYLNQNKTEFKFHIPFATGLPGVENRKTHDLHITNTEIYLKSKKIQYVITRNSTYISNQSTGGYPIENNYKGITIKIIK